jgi:uncharacterized membrane protein
VGGVAALVVSVELVSIISWVIATLVVLTWVWRVIWPQDPEGTERLAERESQSRTTDTGVLIAAAVSLGAVALAVVRASRGTDAEAIAAVLLSIIGAFLSWCLVNTVFALKYARLFYLDDGGIDFDRSGPPAYSDFAYLAFTVGMTYGTSENEPRARMSARRHSATRCSPTATAPSSSPRPSTS